MTPVNQDCFSVLQDWLIKIAMSQFLYNENPSGKSVVIYSYYVIIFLTNIFLLLSKKITNNFEMCGKPILKKKNSFKGLFRMINQKIKAGEAPERKQFTISLKRHTNVQKM